MQHAEKKHRIIFIDLMRAFAVIQMVQGHTVDALLADQYRIMDNPIYSVWIFMRGMTAPIFMFSAGTVFTYLFRLVDKPFLQNPRTIKGIKRGLLLLFLGYLIRYPTWTVFDFSSVTDYSWKTFLAIDVLQLIGFGLFALLFLLYISEKFNLSDYIVFPSIVLILIIISPIIYGINWINYLPQFLAGYFYSGTGSLFPLFPWTAYVLAGGVLGSYLAKHPMAFKTSKFSLTLGTIGLILIGVSALGDILFNQIGFNLTYNSANSNLVLFRIGFVLMLNALVSFISLKAESIPKLFIIVGRNTLLIYVVHLIILYGSAWNTGLFQAAGKSFSGWQAFGSAIMMITLMTIMVMVLNMIKMKNKQLVT